jgi:hypothetical protein
MRRARVEIGSLIVHHSPFAPSGGTTLGRMVENNLTQLVLAHGAFAGPRSAADVHVKAPVPAGAGVSPSSVARAVAHALHRTLQGKV